MASPGAIAQHDDSNWLDFLRLRGPCHLSIRRALSGINLFSGVAIPVTYAASAIDVGRPTKKRNLVRTTLSGFTQFILINVMVERAVADELNGAATTAMADDTAGAATVQALQLG